MVSTSSVKLLGAFFSPFVNRVQIAFNLRSVVFDYVEETLSSKSDLLLGSHPVHRKVPVVIDDDKIICESLIIVQYIDQVWMDNGYSILPSDPSDRAVARFWAAYVDDKLIPRLKKLLAAQEEEKLAIKERIEEGMLALEEAFVEFSKGKAYFGGENIGYIEKITGLKLSDKAKTPELVSWAKTFMLNDAVKNVLPETEMLVEVLKRHYTAYGLSQHGRAVLACKM